MSQPAQRKREGEGKDRREEEKERRVKGRKSSVFTDPISRVPQWCGIQTNPEHYLPYA